MASSLHTWEDWKSTCKKRVISFDLPGFGLIFQRLQSDYCIDSYTLSLRLLDALGVQRVMLVGNALGGEITSANHGTGARTGWSKLVLINLTATQSALSMPLAFQMARRPWLALGGRAHHAQGCGCVQCAQCVRETPAKSRQTKLNATTNSTCA